MTQATSEPRVERLEEMMAELLATERRRDIRQDRTERTIDRLVREVDRTLIELRAFTDELRFNRHAPASTQVVPSAHGQSPSAELLEMRADWGERCRKFGWLARDCVAPRMADVMREVLGIDEPIVGQAEEVSRYGSAGDDGLLYRFDVVAWTADYLCLNETLSELSNKDVATFAARLPSVRDYFPEHADKRIVGVVASLYVDPSVARYAEKKGLIVLGFGEDVMDVLNSPGFVPKAF